MDYKYDNASNYTMDDNRLFDLYCGDVNSIMINICGYILNNMDGNTQH